jgi:hypothetical protein
MGAEEIQAFSLRIAYFIEEFMHSPVKFSYQ